MKTFRKLFYGFGLISTLVLSSSCVTETISEIETNEREANLTVEQLQYKIRIANNTSKIYSFVMTQSLRARGGDIYMLKTSYLRPNYYKIATYKDSKLLGMEIYNNEEVYTYDTKSTRFTKLEGRKKKARLAMLQATATEDKNYRSLFSEIKLTLVDVNNKEYYKMVGITKNNLIPPITIYVNKKTFLPEIVESKMSTGSGKESYYSITKSYTEKLGAKFPNEQEVIIGLRTYRYILEDLKVNIDLKVDDFEPKKAWYEPNI
ncbi:hypothetical protein AAEX28_03315 [Lentisphaerota bacterium WC36G]